MKKLLVVVVSVVVMLVPGVVVKVHAQDICKALVLHDVAAIESPESMLARGEYDTAITQYRISKDYKKKNRFVRMEVIVIQYTSISMEKTFKLYDWLIVR